MRKKRFIIPLVVAFVLICILVVNLLINKKNPILNSYSGYSFGEEATTSDGYFHSIIEGNNLLLYFFDFKQKKDVAVCSRPNCDHKNPDTCDAVLPCSISAIGISQDKIYILSDDGEDNNKSIIYQENVDGSDRTVFMNLNSGVSLGIFIDENYLYYVSCEHEMVESKMIPNSFEATAEITDRLHRINLETKEDVPISDEEKGYKIGILGCSDGVLYYGLNSYGGGKASVIVADGDDKETQNSQEPAYDYIHEDDNRHEIYAFDCNKGTTERILENKTIGVLNVYNNNLCFFENIDGVNVIQSYNPKTKDIKKIFETKNQLMEFKLLDNKLIFETINSDNSRETFYYDFKSNQTTNVNLSDNTEDSFSLVSESNDLFIMQENKSMGGSSKLCYVNKSDFYKGNIKPIAIDAK